MRWAFGRVVPTIPELTDRQLIHYPGIALSAVESHPEAVAGGAREAHLLLGAIDATTSRSESWEFVERATHDYDHLGYG